MIKKILPLFLISTAAVAGFFPVNRGMINQATVGTVAGSTVTFVATQNQIYIAEGGVAGATYKFPDARNLPNDWWYKVINNSSGTVTASNNINGSIAELLTGRAGYFQLTDNSTQAGVWKYSIPVALADLGNYYTKAEHINASAGAADAGKPIVLNGSGFIDTTMLPAGGGYSSIGTLDSGTPSANGASGPATSILLQSASALYPGLINTTTQTVSGSKTFNDPIVGSLIGNADTSTAFAVNPTNCSAGNYPLGIDASGNVENCTAAGAGGAPPVSIGTIDSQSKSADGLVTGSSNVLYAQNADASFPGLVSTGTQTIAGAKTLTSTLNLGYVTASRFLRNDGSRNVTSSLINLGNTTNDVTGTVAVGNGGTGLTATPTNGQLAIGNGSGYTLGTITAGSGITVTNSTGSITINSTGSGSSKAYYSGYHDGISANCTNNSTVGYGDYSACTDIALNSDPSSNITCSTAGSSLPGIACTLPATGDYEVTAIYQFEIASADIIHYVKIVDGSNNPVSRGGAVTPGNVYNNQGTQTGIYTASGTSVTFKLYGAVSGGTASIRVPGLSGSAAIIWIIKQL